MRETLNSNLGIVAVSAPPILWQFIIGGHCFRLCSHPLLVLQTILTAVENNQTLVKDRNNKNVYRNKLPVDSISFSLCRILNVGIIEEILDTQQDLFDGNGWPPILFLIQQWQTDSTFEKNILVQKATWNERC